MILCDNKMNGTYQTDFSWLFLVGADNLPTRNLSIRVLWTSEDYMDLLKNCFGSNGPEPGSHKLDLPINSPSPNIMMVSSHFGLRESYYLK